MRELPRSLPLHEWPEADRVGWQEACRLGVRLKAGGAASHLGDVSREDYERRYGAFLGFLQRQNLLKSGVAAAAEVTRRNIDAYLADLRSRVSSVTTYNCIAKVKRVARLLAPDADLRWLTEIENDLAFVMEPRSKFERLVFTQVLVEAGLRLVTEAQELKNDPLSSARAVRNGLMIALLAPCPIRLKNFAALEVGTTFRNEHDSWWILLSARVTKNRRADDRRVPELLYPAIDLYLGQSRPTLLSKGAETNALWISSTTGGALTRKNLGTLISRITRETVGVDISPHLFRTAGASTSALLAGERPHLGSALLGHTDPRITEEYYRRVSSINAVGTLSAMVRKISARES